MATQEELDQRLFNAIQNGDYDQALSALNDGADANAKQESGLSALTRASFYQERIAFELIRRGADIHYTPESGHSAILQAANAGHEKLFFELVRRGVSLECELKGETIREEWVGVTLMHVAALSGNLNIIKYLIDQGLDPTKKTREGQPPLDFLEKAPEKKRGAAKKLLERGVQRWNEAHYVEQDPNIVYVHTKLGLMDVTKIFNFAAHQITSLIYTSLDAAPSAVQTSFADAARDADLLTALQLHQKHGGTTRLYDCLPSLQTTQGPIQPGIKLERPKPA